MKDWKAKIRRGALAAVLLTLVCSMALAALSYPFTSVTTDSVRMRKTPSSSAVVLKTLKQGTSVEVLTQAIRKIVPSEGECDETML